MRRFALVIAAALLASPAFAQETARLIAECDRLAADDLDPARPGSVVGLPSALIDAKAAVPACLAAAKAAPAEARIVFQLGRAWQRERKLENARAVYQLAESLGYSIASAALAAMLEQGSGGNRDDKEARRLYEKAAAAGLAIAMYRLGLMYRNGTGVAKDAVQGERWSAQALAGFTQLAEKGSAQAMLLVALISTPAFAERDAAGLIAECDRLAGNDYGRQPIYWPPLAQIDAPGAVPACLAAAEAVRSDGRVIGQLGRALRAHRMYENAQTAYQLADSLGESAALLELGVMFAQGLGVNRDLSEARRLYEKAAAGGQFQAMALLGVMYESGTGVAKDAAQSERWNEQAVERLLALRSALAPNRAWAQWCIGWRFVWGEPMKDFAVAMRWFKSSEAGGVARSASYIGFLYEQGGEGVPRDLAEAERWYAKAAQAGEADAVVSLERLHKARAR